MKNNILGNQVAKETENLKYQQDFKASLLIQMVTIY